MDPGFTGQGVVSGTEQDLLEELDEVLIVARDLYAEARLGGVVLGELIRRPPNRPASLDLFAREVGNAGIRFRILRSRRRAIFGASDIPRDTPVAPRSLSIPRNVALHGARSRAKIGNLLSTEMLLRRAALRGD